MSDLNLHDLTPTEELILEVLTARLRLGEKLWTFSSRHNVAMRKLRLRGIIRTMNGVTENTIRAYLTNEYAALLQDYSSPIYKKCANEIADDLDELGFDSNIGNVVRKRHGSAY